jgi:hypothetical protein
MWVSGLILARKIDLPEPRDLCWVGMESCDVHFGGGSQKQVIIFGLHAVDLGLNGLIHDFVFGQGNGWKLIIQTGPHVAVHDLSENSTQQADFGLLLQIPGPSLVGNEPSDI